MKNVKSNLGPFEFAFSRARLMLLKFENPWGSSSLAVLFTILPDNVIESYKSRETGCAPWGWSYSGSSANMFLTRDRIHSLVAYGVLYLNSIEISMRLSGSFWTSFLWVLWIQCPHCMGICWRRPCGTWIRFSLPSGSIALLMGQEIPRSHPTAIAGRAVVICNQ